MTWSHKTICPRDFYVNSSNTFLQVKAAGCSNWWGSTGLTSRLPLLNIVSKLNFGISFIWPSSDLCYCQIFLIQQAWWEVVVFRKHKKLVSNSCSEMLRDHWSWTSLLWHVWSNKQWPLTAFHSPLPCILFSAFSWTCKRCQMFSVLKLWFKIRLARQVKEKEKSNPTIFHSLQGFFNALV